MADEPPLSLPAQLVVLPAADTATIPLPLPPDRSLSAVQGHAPFVAAEPPLPLPAPPVVPPDTGPIPLPLPPDRSLSAVQGHAPFVADEPPLSLPAPTVVPPVAPTHPVALPSTTTAVTVPSQDIPAQTERPGPVAGHTPPAVADVTPGPSADSGSSPPRAAAAASRRQLRDLIHEGAVT